MASPESSGKSPETKGIGGMELKKLSPESQKLTSAEREALEKDLAARGEKAEKVIEKHAKEKEPVIKSEESHHEKSKTVGEGASHKSAHRPKPKTERERRTVYNSEIKKIQKDMPAVQRVFSKLIHTNSVEKISDATQKTIFRPSAIIAGSAVGLTLGILVYIIAVINNYSLGNLEILSFAVLGALIGLVLEYIINRAKHKKQLQDTIF